MGDGSISADSKDSSLRKSSVSHVQSCTCQNKQTSCMFTELI